MLKTMFGDFGALILLTLGMSQFGISDSPPGSIVPVRQLTAEKTVPVNGVVVNALTGQPIDRAVVEATVHVSSEGRTAVKITGADGRFTVDCVAGRTKIRVSRRGYRSEDGNNQLTLTAPADPPNYPITAKLVPLGVITGRVVDAEGEPLQGLTVSALSRRIQEGRARFTAHAADRTDDQGTYRLWYITPGTYILKLAGKQLTATGVGEMPASNDARETYGPLYYPDSLSRGAAQAISVGPAETIQADFRVQGQQAFRVSGVLRNFASYGRNTIQLLRDGDVLANHVLINVASGAFQILDVAPGKYTLRAKTPQGSGSIEGRAEVVVVDRDVTGIAVLMSEGFNVIARIVGREVAPDDLSIGLGVEAVPWGNDDSLERRHFAQWHDDGTREETPGVLRAEGLFPGRYALAVTPGREYCVESVRAGSSDVLSEGFTVTDAGGPSLEVFLTKACGQVIVRLDTEDLAYRLVAVPKSMDMALPLTTYVADSQTGEVLLLPPGEYELYAFRIEDEVEYLNPAALAELAPLTERIALSANKTIEVKLQTIDRKRRRTSR